MKIKKIIKILFLAPLVILFVLFEIFVLLVYCFPLYVGFIVDNDAQQQTTKSVPDKGQNE